MNTSHLKFARLPILMLAGFLLGATGAAAGPDKNPSPEELRELRAQAAAQAISTGQAAEESGLAAIALSSALPESFETQRIHHNHGAE